jgi:hypothetical protein
MALEWALIFLAIIGACVYFSYNSGLREGVETATLLTLAKLEEEGLIHFSESGKIKSGPQKEKLL